MIVVDTNVLAYFWIRGEATGTAQRLYAREPEWVAPALWRSELRNVLATLIRTGRMAQRVAVETMAAAEEEMADREVPVDSPEVLRLAAASGLTAYDCEFVALAKELNVPLVTADRRILAAFPKVARSLAQAAEAGA